MLSTRRRAQKLRTRTDLVSAAPVTRRRGRSSLFRPPLPGYVVDDDESLRAASECYGSVRASLAARTRSNIDDVSTGTRFFNQRTEAQWILRGGGDDRQVVQAALESAVRAQIEEDLDKPRDQTEVKPDDAPRSVSSEVSALLQPRRRGPRVPSGLLDSRDNRKHYDLRRGPASLKERRVQFSRARRRDGPLSDDVDNNRNRPKTASDNPKQSWFDPDADHRWRLPIGKPLKRADLLGSLPDKFPNREAMTKWSSGTASDSDPRTPSRGPFQGDRSDRKATPGGWREDGSSARPLDRTGKRIGLSGARWRGLMARKDLVDGTADAFCTETNDKDLSPRSSLDIEEATSFLSWDEPPSTSVRGWRSNHSLSYRPQPDHRPRLIRDIGRQNCFNDLTDIVDASNEPCVSYDRQIFDPVSKLWKYVELSQPSSSPWELRAVSSPVTCSVSGTEEAISSNERGAAPASVAPSMEVGSASATTPPAPAETTKRRNSSPGFAAIQNAIEAKHAFKASRDEWLGTTRKSIYGPANLEEVIFASELDDERILRRASMA